MSDLNPAAAAYAGKLRVRACGICIQNSKLLLVRHGKTIGNSAFWAPPGGGIQYGESIQDSLRREFEEETGLQVEVTRFLFVNEFLEEPLHAVEFFFEVKVVGGSMATGSDSEAAGGNQLIEHLEWLTAREIQSIPFADKHRSLQLLLSLDDLLGLPHNFIP
ncbi:NUDIX domain-containing protein [Pontibacter anaerobius]|uniref:NUDIX domain-containing protein n=1 Tax=Pontibacter anaerobius TaxID=2993940 RepID=A0ABT3RIZ9_9BACT|nr:NUDIX domain-containing protein [Pontibacter anaerobius]MCX2741833.1 NUDIX domain-containing protein [Pontibacter anaerobius]